MKLRPAKHAHLVFYAVWSEWPPGRRTQDTAVAFKARVNPDTPAPVNDPVLKQIVTRAKGWQSRRDPHTMIAKESALSQLLPELQRAGYTIHENAPGTLGSRTRPITRSDDRWGIKVEP